MFRTTIPPENGDEIVRLNVGGTLFATTRTTLSSVPNTFFHGLLSRSYTTRLVDSAIFIDRSPTHFNYILDGLRHLGRINLPLDAMTWPEIEREAAFYGVPFSRPPTCKNCHRMFDPEFTERCIYHSGVFTPVMMEIKIKERCTDSSHQDKRYCKVCASAVPEYSLARLKQVPVNTWTCCKSADVGAKGCRIDKHEAL
ncbi:BTB/POZ protein [Jimgerdemannia flammicorona]|uniref:BTB/POZ protein n=2 Tax=Jimgerdemannia flammicorona TaxID=994334 RepID=A0A433D468_9FUNG|nr:BTB/POZ protein [Jimgerdemannia flammicorona]RUS23711.1 BTB/POZ protein [Jimgerdemannia flammicorona]